MNIYIHTYIYIYIYDLTHFMFCLFGTIYFDSNNLTLWNSHFRTFQQNALQQKREKYLDKYIRIKYI